MITVKNIQTGEFVKVLDVNVKDSKIMATWQRPEPGTRFYSKNTAVVKTDALFHDEEHGVDCRILELAEGWELVEKPTRTPKAGRLAATKKAEKKAEPVIMDAVVEPVEEPATVEEPTTDADDTDTHADEQALIAAIKNLKGGAVDIKKVRQIVAEEFARLAAEEPKKAVRVLDTIKKAAGDKKEVYCNNFKRIVSKVSRGNNVYLFGPAGSGKSHTAEQVARELGLEFYGQTTIQFAHDVRGYGDAGGNFQETPFFKAFSGGGLYFQDEYDRSNAEAAIVLNSALANGWYDFPVVGRVEAHPDFRFMAAGNTTMTGATEEYVTGQEIDASSRDRFAFFFEVGYNKTVELSIAHGDKDTVNFVNDVRRALKQTGIKHVVSYRATAAMTDELENENDREACITEAVFKGLEVDERSMIYGALKDTSNPWAEALRNTLK